MKRVALYTKNPRLHRRISLILHGLAEVEMKDPPAGIGYSLTIIDKESFPYESDGVYLPYEIRDDKYVNLPIPHELIIKHVEGVNGDDSSIILGSDKHTANVSGREIKLTDVEFRLLSKLCEHDSFVSREELLFSVWDGKKDIGVVNVYVHYLREKLESDGKKIIISSRKEGYKIDEKYKRRI